MYNLFQIHHRLWLEVSVMFGIQHSEQIPIRIEYGDGRVHHFGTRLLLTNQLHSHSVRREAQQHQEVQDPFDSNQTLHYLRIRSVQRPVSGLVLIQKGKISAFDNVAQ